MIANLPYWEGRMPVAAQYFCKARLISGVIPTDKSEVMICSLFVFIFHPGPLGLEPVRLGRDRAGLRETVRHCAAFIRQYLDCASA
jgi:hypothetical protein